MLRTIILAALIFTAASPAIAYCLRPYDASGNDAYLVCLINEVSNTVSGNAEVANSNSERLDLAFEFIKSLSTVVQRDAKKIAELEARVDALQNE